MFKKILIANRGEIAVRIIRSCREMGIETVAVYSDIDSDALHVQMADEAICIGPAAVSESYLNMQAVISATVISGAEAIHPGFGFLSENSKFAQLCKECGIIFIGPDAEAIDKAGNKSRAKQIMKDAGVPIIPGSDGKVSDLHHAQKIAKSIGYPVMIKASAGGGGKGMRLVKSDDELKMSFEMAAREAESAFGDGSMYIEKYIENPRHVEMQILADNYGNTIYLGERDCSIQRRNQKVLEEAPSPLVNDKLRKEMGKMAVKAAKAVKYKNAGTIEFLVDSNGKFYFMEMNTRIQVEHPITEMVTGLDLIMEQIKIAWGNKLKLQQSDIAINGHSIECRINAENPENNFRPSPGTIKSLYIPGGNGVRVDSSIYQGYTIPSNYDSMVAKLIVHGKTRADAINKMKRALGEFVVEGISTNIDFQYQILNNKTFIEGKADTGFINKEFNLNN